MRHRYVTHKRDGLHWIIGTRLVSEFGEPETPLDIPKPPKGVELFDDRHRPLYTLDADGKLMYRGRPQEEQDEDERKQERRDALAFLKSTDWYVIRNIEEGVEIPDDIRMKRRAARLKAMT